VYHISFYGNIFLFFDGGVVASVMGTMVSPGLLSSRRASRHIGQQLVGISTGPLQHQQLPSV